MPAKLIDLAKFPMPPVILNMPAMFERLVEFAGGATCYQQVERSLSISQSPMVSTAGLSQLGQRWWLTEQWIVTRTLTLDAYEKELRHRLVVEWTTQAEKQFYQECYAKVGIGLTLAMIAFPEAAWVWKALDFAKTGFDFAKAVGEDKVGKFFASEAISNIGGAVVKQFVPATMPRWHYASRQFWKNAKNTEVRLKAGGEGGVKMSVDAFFDNNPQADKYTPTIGRLAAVQKFRMAVDPEGYRAKVKKAFEARAAARQLDSERKDSKSCPW